MSRGGRILLAVILLVIGGAAWLIWQAEQPGSVSPDRSAPPVNPPPTTVDAGTAAASAADRNFNPGWIGAACSADGDCDYSGGFCLLPEEGFPHGYCSQLCRHICPDRKGALYSPTFCIEDPTYGRTGICAAQCNLHLLKTGCRPGYICTSLQRIGESIVRMVCLPDRGTPFPATTCTRKLDKLDVAYARPDLADAPSRAARSGDSPPDQPTCQIDTPVLLSSPIHGVDFRHKGQRYADHLLVACRMALAVEKMSVLLTRLEVVEVEHNGTFVCRGVAGTHHLSGHGRGLAIDITGFERAQTAPVNVAGDWNGPEPNKKKFLRKLLGRLQDSHIFDVILAPDNSPSHQDHIHLEVNDMLSSSKSDGGEK
ncbi:MAG TPA: extensin family protein [Myxococcota bacterium]|nr:extensin family protein [Myxococcota bacterium]